MGIGNIGDMANQHSDKINEQIDNAQEQHGDKLGEHKDTVNNAVDGAQDKFLNGGENKGDNA
ncbi:MAG: Rv0909 family putative TA system antitoxin [Micrococcus sp.]|nr:Rv0909 family putative TA system antitoxin [Micrococcus sp.]